MKVVYLHGFASSPQSTKARFFAGKFAEAGVAFEAPALDQQLGELRTTVARIAQMLEGN